MGIPEKSHELRGGEIPESCAGLVRDVLRLRRRLPCVQLAPPGFERQPNTRFA